MVILSVLIIIDINIKAPLWGLIIITISHLYLTYSMVDHVRKWKDFTTKKSIEYIFIMIFNTAIIKSSIGYYNGHDILDFIGWNINPTIARIVVLSIVIIIIYFFSRKKIKYESGWSKWLKKGG